MFEIGLSLALCFSLPAVWDLCASAGASGMLFCGRFGLYLQVGFSLIWKLRVVLGRHSSSLGSLVVISLEISLG